MANTYLDQLVEYPAKALQQIGTNEKIAKLLTNNPNLDMDSDEADDVFDKYLFDYIYVDDTTSSAEAYVCVEAELQRVENPNFQDFRIYCTIICHKRFMAVDPSLFPGMIGNRRDNLVRYVDSVLDGSPIYGVGNLTLVSVKTVPSPVGFSSRELTYKIADFRNKGLTT